MPAQKVEHYQIQNLTQKPISVRLNSGKTLLLAPGIKSPEIKELEVKDNGKLEKLKKLNVIILIAKEEQITTAKTTTTAKTSSTSTKTKPTTGNDAAKENSEAKS